MMSCVMFQELCIYYMISVIFLYDFSLQYGKGNMIVEGFMTCHWMRKNITVDFYILYNAAVRDKDVQTYVSNISKIKS